MHRIRTSLIAIASAISLLLVAETAPAQAPDPSIITLERIHETSDFRTEGMARVRWLEDGTGYTTLEAADGGGREIVRHDPATGDRDVLVTAAQLTPEGAGRPLGVADYDWSNDGRKLIVFTNTRRVWRANTRGDYWILDLESNLLHRLAGGMEQTWTQFAKLSPDAKHAAYVHKNDLYVEDLASGDIHALTDTGSDTLSNGTFDWVYEEEWGLRDGFRWSPDSSSIAFWQLDAEGIGEFTLIDNTAGLYPTLKQYRYPKVGTTNPRCRVGVVPASGGDIRWMDLPGDERDDYVARMEWAADSNELVIQRINRRQNENRVLLANAASGSVREVFRDEDDAWIEACDDLVWLAGGTRFTFVSERDGWSHVYVVARADGESRVVTRGEYDVTRIVRIDERGGFVYFIASPDDPTQRFLYRVPLAGGRAERLTPADAGGTHAYDVSADARFAIHTASSFGVPPRVELVSLPDHAVVRTFVTNDELIATLDGLDTGPHEFFRVSIGDGLEVDGWAIKPPDFDPTKRYPLLVYVYGEPAGQTVRDQWGGGYYLWHLMLAQQGYIVVSLDNRGTPAPRGRAWRKSVYGKIGITAAEDQAAAVRSLLTRWPYLDRERVGVWGWSGGGSMTLNALFKYPELYRTGVAIAFVANQRFYDTIYQERYMGLPEDNPEGFEQGSPITHAKNLEGNLLIVYGTGDDNCHYQNCEALINELVAHGKQFEMMAYPGRTHGIHEGRGTRKHLFTMMTRFLQEHME
ncbi:MAG: S9 family peptidase [Planctomycetota bacterium]|jgi:dipeptidyl-peptidase-4